jgi:phosphoribosyl-AMP cyclohydrolase
MFIVEINPNKSFNTQSIEETNILNLDFMKLSTFSDHNVIPVAVQNAITQEVILVAYTNEIAFKETVKQKKAIFWSTSRNELWLKGQDSGNTFTIRSIFVNCEQNSLVYQVTPDKDNICHTTRNNVVNNCFYREINLETLELIFKDDK